MNYQSQNQKKIEKSFFSSRKYQEYQIRCIRNIQNVFSQKNDPIGVQHQQLVKELIKGLICFSKSPLLAQA